MKKFLLLMIITGCFTSFSVAQNFTYGLKAGGNSSTIHFTNDEYETSSVLGFHGGAFGNFAVNEEFSLQTEIVYYSGGNEENTNSSSGEIFTSNLLIPVLAKYEVAPGFQLSAGPHYNLLLSIEEEYGSGSRSDISALYKSGVLGIGGGVAYGLSSLVEGLQIEARYTTDLSEINEANVNGGELKRQDIFLGFLYSF